MKFKVGDRVKVVGNTAGHQKPVGSEGIVKAAFPNLSGTGMIAYQLDIGGGSYFYEADLVGEPVTKEALEEKLKSLLAKVEDVKMRIQFLVENNLEKFDESEFKVFKALVVVESSKSRIDKARALAEIIKG